MTLCDLWLPHSYPYRVFQIAYAPLLLDLAMQERVQQDFFDARFQFARGPAPGRPRYARAPAYDPFVTLCCLALTHIVSSRLLMRRCCFIGLCRSVCNRVLSTHGASSLAGPRRAAPGTRGRPRMTLCGPWLPRSDPCYVCQRAHRPLLLDLAMQQHMQKGSFDARCQFARGAHTRPPPVRTGALARPLVTLRCFALTHIVSVRLNIRHCCLIWLRRSVCNLLFSTHGAISLAGPAPGRPRYARAPSYDPL